MSEKCSYQTFNSKRLYITLENGDQVDVPGFVGKSYKRYRYNTSDKTIEKQCYKCKTWFKVLKVRPDKLEDIHNESEFHFISHKSGYGSYCQPCTNPPASPKKSKELQKYSVFLTAENHRYIMLRCAAQNSRKTELINSLIDRERLQKPIEKFL